MTPTPSTEQTRAVSLPPQDGVTRTEPTRGSETGETAESLNGLLRTGEDFQSLRDGLRDQTFPAVGSPSPVPVSVQKYPKSRVRVHRLKVRYEDCPE